MHRAGTGRRTRRRWSGGVRRLDNVQHCIETVLHDKIPGDFIETGVWRGGTVILVRGILKAYGDPPDRLVYVADWFRGSCRPPTPIGVLYPEHAPFVDNPNTETAPRSRSPARPPSSPFRRARCNATSSSTASSTSESGFSPGWFKDTLPTIHDRTWAVVRLDGDYYESTMDGIVNLYPKLSPGGFLIVDDYSIPACTGPWRTTAPNTASRNR